MGECEEGGTCELENTGKERSSTLCCGEVLVHLVQRRNHVDTSLQKMIKK